MAAFGLDLDSPLAPNVDAFINPTKDDDAHRSALNAVVCYHSANRVDFSVRAKCCELPSVQYQNMYTNMTRVSTCCTVKRTVVKTPALYLHTSVVLPRGGILGTVLLCVLFRCYAQPCVLACAGIQVAPQNLNVQVLFFVG